MSVAVVAVMEAMEVTEAMEEKKVEMEEKLVEIIMKYQAAVVVAVLVEEEVADLDLVAVGVDNLAGKKVDLVEDLALALVVEKVV